jgi:hypothetical protein
MLNWRRDPGYEQRRMQQFEQRRIQHEQRMKQLESEITASRSRKKQSS